MDLPALLASSSVADRRMPEATRLNRLGMLTRLATLFAWREQPAKINLLNDP